MNITETLEGRKTLIGMVLISISSILRVQGQNEAADLLDAIAVPLIGYGIVRKVEKIKK